MGDNKEKLSFSNFWRKLINSGDNSNKENTFSARKLSAFVGVTTGVVLSYLNCTPENLEYILTAWLVFALLCLSVVTIQEVIALKNGSQQPATAQKEDANNTPAP